ncbi:MAG: DUF423 domain-containing protein [Rhodospirillaceae bacterium]|nr:DUF423 domain-containing protein [Rhodospirillaceae bacterium]
MIKRDLTGLWLLLAGFFGASGVGAGAYGWHSLGESDSAREIFMMGVAYQMWHALALMGVAWLASRDSSKLTALAGICFSLGIVLFSGTLYFFAVAGTVPVEGAAPIGGWMMMGGWAVFMWRGVTSLRTAA